MRFLSRALLLLLALASASARLGDSVDEQDKKNDVEDSNASRKLGGDEEEVTHSHRYLQVPAASRIDGEYVIRFTSRDAKIFFKELMEKYPGARILHEYTRVFIGIAVTGIPSHAMRQFARDHDDVIVSVEEAQVMHASNVVSWGLDRIDQRSRNLNNVYNTPDGLDGSGVDVYIIDTGVMIEHEEFAGRIVPGFDATNTNNEGVDGQGHGTHGTSLKPIQGCLGRTLDVPIRSHRNFCSFL